ncbi:hypothetical protein NPIL_464391 [Nephila pilipes]|uniref:Uncharacterized protein n=1 Tax=Nephila pilipes TaxID=299642 RepID=A0A8X6TAY4_NEPPI|nr:hypothetical protein NPIL_464391 [Nephila pilipes]
MEKENDSSEEISKISCDNLWDLNLKKAYHRKKQEQVKMAPQHTDQQIKTQQFLQISVTIIKTNGHHAPNFPEPAD